MYTFKFAWTLDWTNISEWFWGPTISGQKFVNQPIVRSQVRQENETTKYHAFAQQWWLNYLSVFSAKDIAAVDTERVAQKYLNVFQAGLELESKTGFFI